MCMSSIQDLAQVDLKIETVNWNIGLLEVQSTHRSGAYGCETAVGAPTSFHHPFIHTTLQANHSGGGQVVPMHQIWRATFLIFQSTPAYSKCTFNTPKVLKACSNGSISELLGRKQHSRSGTLCVHYTVLIVWEWSILFCAFLQGFNKYNVKMFVLSIRLH